MTEESFAACIESCDACAEACDRCAAECLRMENPRGLGRCIALDVDCAALCRLAAAFMARHSESVAPLCRVCAEVCEACADECSRHDMSHCRDCAAECRRCARDCRELVRMYGGAARGSAQPHAH